MNILIIGLGSIGQRHLRNLKLIEPKSNFYAIKRNREKSTPLLNNFNQVLNGNIKKNIHLLILILFMKFIKVILK